MPAFGAADVVLFGIQAGVRLFGQARQAYVERTRERDLVLPLPGVDHGSTGALARFYFDRGGGRYLVESPRLRDLHKKASNLASFEANDAEGFREYVELYDYYRALDRGLAKDGLLVGDIVALNSISQWRKGEEPHPRAVRRIAGTLTEIGVDFFAGGPGAGLLAGNAPAKELLRGVLDALDDEAFGETGLEGVVEKVFLATLDSIARNPALLSSDARTRDLVAGVARGIVADVNRRLLDLPEGDRLFAADGLAELAGTVFRSVVRHGAEVVLRSPESFLGVRAGGEAALVTRVGTALLDAVLATDADGVDLAGLFTGATLDEVAKGALGVVAEHPELLGLAEDEAGIEAILKEVAAGLAAETRALVPDLLPDVVRLILDRTAENLDLLWKADGSEHLLVTATKTLFKALARGGSKWPRLSRTQILEVVEAVLDELGENPALLTRKVGNQTALAAAVDAVLKEAATLDLGAISAETLAGLLEEAVKAAALRWDFLEKVGAKTALGRAIEAVFAAAFPDDAGGAAWTLAGGRTLRAVTAIVLGKLAEHGAGKAHIEIVRTALTEIAADLEEGRPFSLGGLAAKLEEKLAA
jgi:hypothetical protein